MTDTPQDQDSKTEDWPLGRRIVFLFAGIGMALAALITWFLIFWNIFFNFENREEILRNHFLAVVGLPVAAFFAFVLVFFLRQTTGQIEIEGFGFKFRGVSGPLVMWVICFVAIASVIKMLW
jgi:hypothetical protein